MECDEIEGGGAITVHCHGTPDVGEQDRVKQRIDDLAARYGSVRLLVNLDEPPDQPPVVAWEDLKWAVRHFRNVSRCAIVGNRRWRGWWTRSVRPFLPCESQYFGRGELSRAREWVSA